ncbi:MAG: hypothetical protein E7017_03150 [Alphaproteobacteria bacterium]|nr:hypothetical protein [Alphaproteobacteria bacterium]
MSKKENWLLIIAGPNGAGKSTFYETILRSDPLFKNAPFVNLDNYAKEFAGDGDPNDYMVLAGRKVRAEIANNFKQKKNFVYETTASGRTHLRIMEEAHKKGYKVGTVFIGLSKVELSHTRVQKRVNEGGHSVPPEDIERRYPRVIKNFPDMLARSDLAAVFDNSGRNPYKLIFLMDKYYFRVFYKYPRWVNNAMKERKTRKDFMFVNTDDIKKAQKSHLQEIALKLFGKSR